MITPDRLDELETYRPDDDTPDDAKVRIPAGDLRDLVKLIPVVQAVFESIDSGDASLLNDAAELAEELRGE